jgi:hypothetical protein
VVSGVWDAVGLLFGLSGFLLAAGPAIIRGFYEHSLQNLPVGENKAAIDDALTETWLLWTLLIVLYFIAVITGSVYLLLARRDRTVIYNVEPSVFDAVFPQVLDGLGVLSRRVGNRFFLRSAPAPLNVVAEPVPAQSESHVTVQPQGVPHPFEPNVELARPIDSSLPAGQEAVLDVDPFEAMHHVTLHWRSNNELLRQTVDSTLARTLTQVPTYYNSAGNWFLGVAACLFCLLFLDLVLYVVAKLTAR